MTAALLLNFAILAFLGAALAITGNPLVMFGLLLLKDLPFGLLLPSEKEDQAEAEPAQAMGFL